MPGLRGVRAEFSVVATGHPRHGLRPFRGAAPALCGDPSSQALGMVLTSGPHQRLSTGLHLREPQGRSPAAPLALAGQPHGEY